MNLKVRMTEQIDKYKIKLVDSSINFAPSMWDFQTITKTVGEPYDGEYEVKPKFEVQTLPTAEKYLARDVTVDAIEVSKVSNLSGGKTVYIGGIFDGE